MIPVPNSCRTMYQNSAPVQWHPVQQSAIERSTMYNTGVLGTICSPRQLRNLEVLADNTLQVLDVVTFKVGAAAQQ
jgi:hypothetical protein